MTWLWRLNQYGSAITETFRQVISLLASDNRFEYGLSPANEADRSSLGNIITFCPLMKRCCSRGDGRAENRVWRAMARWKVSEDMFLCAEIMGALKRPPHMVSEQRVPESLHDSDRQPHFLF